MRGKLIVLVTRSLWDEPHRGRHHYANALADQNTVIWMNRPIYRGEASAKSGLEHVERGLYVLHAGSTVLPGRADHHLNWCNRGRLNLLLQTLKSSPFGRTPDLVWIYDYKATAFARHFRCRCPRIYFCNDYFGEYAYKRYESALCREVDHVFCTAPKLRDRLVGFNPKCTFMPHGTWPTDSPKPFIKKDRPESAAYIGTLREDIDTEFLWRIVKETSIRLVLGGPVTECLPEQRSRFEELLADHRVSYLGNLSQAQIAQTLAEVDICLLPYLIDLRQFMFPLKYFDYLAAGKPIVATPYFDWPEPYSQFVSVYDSSRDLRQFIEGAYDAWSGERHEASLALADQSTWHMRIEQVSEILSVD